MSATTTRSGRPGRTQRLAVALPKSTRSWVDQVAVWTNQPPAATAAGLIGVFAELLRVELTRLLLTVPEADALSRIIGNDFTLGLTVGKMRVFAEVSEAFDLAHQSPGGLSSYADQFGIDENALLEKLRRLTPTADLALRLAIAQEAESEQGADQTDADRYRAVGINIFDLPEKTR